MATNIIPPGGAHVPITSAPLPLSTTTPLTGLATLVGSGPPTMSVSMWASSVGCAITAHMGGTYKHGSPPFIPLPSLILAQITTGHRSWVIAPGMSNPEPVMGMWLYEIAEVLSGKISYVWVNSTGTVIERYDPQSSTHNTALARMPHANHLGSSGEGGHWQGETIQGNCGIASLPDGFVVQVYRDVDGVRVPFGYVSVDSGFAGDFLKAWAKHQEGEKLEAEGEQTI